MSTAPSNHPYSRAQTILRNDAHPVKIAVLEISTRACKLLIADIRELEQGFTWEGFRNQGNLTNLGMQTETDGSITWDSFSELVLPHIKRHLARLHNHNIDHVYTIATAALRQATNGAEILQRLFDETGLNVEILTQEQEGRASASAYQWNSTNERDNNLLLIDQGGGSTEFLGFNQDLEKLTFKKSPSLQMGTSSVVHWLTQHASNLSLTHAVKHFQSHFQRILEDSLVELKDHMPFMVVGMGSGLTQATHKRGNQKQHGTCLSQERLQTEILFTIADLSKEFENFATIDAHLKTLTIESNEHHKLFDQLTKLLGCTMFNEILSALKVDSITINGLGLRYGVCRQIIEHYYPDLVRGRHHLQLQQHSISVDGIQEGAYTIGKVVSIVDFGAFVQLPHDHVGLLHKREMSNARLGALKGRPIRVKVRNIFTDANGKQCFDLEL